jgi:hypothetical protein
MNRNLGHLIWSHYYAEGMLICCKIVVGAHNEKCVLEPKLTGSLYFKNKKIRSKILKNCKKLHRGNDVSFKCATS